MNELAITVIGADRTGIVADLTGILAALGANLTDSTMTRLRGHFAMTLICTADAGQTEVQSALDGLTGLTITVAEVAAESTHAQAGHTYLLNVHGADRLGIVAAVTRAVAGHGGNITDLTTRLTGPLYVLLAEVDLPHESVDSLTKRLSELASEMNVEISLHRLEPDLL